MGRREFIKADPGLAASLRAHGQLDTVKPSRHGPRNTYDKVEILITVLLI